MKKEEAPNVDVKTSSLVENPFSYNSNKTKSETQPKILPQQEKLSGLKTLKASVKESEK